MSRRKRILWLAVVVVAAPIAAILVFSMTVLGPPGLDGERDRYRTGTEIVVSDNGAEARNTVVGECTENRSSNWNTGVQNGVSREGDDPFVVLADRSLLLLRDLRSCLPSPVKAGDAYAFDPDLTAAFANGRVRMPYAHAWRFDSIDDPTSLAIYFQPELFRAGVDGLRVTEAKLAFAGRGSTAPLPFAAEDAFPWLAGIPWAEIGHPDYGAHLYRSTFSGFEVRLDQLGEAQRCDKFERDADGPVVVTGDVWDTCPPWGGQSLGWLTATPSADFGRIDYSYARRSTQRIATLYRATWLAVRGAPGLRDGNDFYWRPVVCIDGQCVPTEAARSPSWDGFRFYYPKKNQVISVRWQSPAVSTAFRRRPKAS